SRLLQAVEAAIPLSVWAARSKRKLGLPSCCRADGPILQGIGPVKAGKTATPPRRGRRKARQREYLRRAHRRRLQDALRRLPTSRAVLLSVRGQRFLCAAETVHPDGPACRSYVRWKSQFSKIAVPIS